MSAPLFLPNELSLREHINLYAILSHFYECATFLPFKAIFSGASARQARQRSTMGKKYW